MNRVRFDAHQFPQDPTMNWALLEARLHESKNPNDFISFESPSSLPDSLLLPPVLFGDLLIALARQENVDPPVEESQFIGTQWKSPLFVDTKTVASEPHRVNAMDEILRILNNNSATITFWHTHSKYKSPYLTPDDISRSMNFSDRAILTMVGTPKYIWCLVKTKEVPRNTKSIREAFSEDKKLYEQVSAVYDSDHRPPDFAALSEFLESAGYALYVWFDQDGALVKDAAASGRFENGIPLKKIVHNPSDELHHQLEHHAQVHLPHPDEVPKLPDATFLEFLGNISGASKLAKKVRLYFTGKKLS